jgi:hypothetical protein
MTQIYTLSLNNGLSPRIEVFRIDADRLDQAEDAGWYYQMSVDDQELGDPQGPFRSDEDALRAASSLFVQ